MPHGGPPLVISGIVARSTQQSRLHLDDWHDWFEDPAGGRMEARRRPRVRRHPLRGRVAVGSRGDRQDHDLPARGPQRVPAPNAVRAPARVQRGARRSRRRRDHPHRRGRRGLLLGRRSAHPGRRRLHRRRRRRAEGHRPAQRPRPPGADPAHAEAGHRHGRGLRDRRRSRAARRVRSHDRRGQRAVRPDRPARRLVRRRLRLGVCWRATSARSSRARCGSCAASTTRNAPTRWDS